MTEPDGRDLERRQITEVVAGRTKQIDTLRILAEATLGSVPVVGSGLTGLFKLCWAPAFERRTQMLLEMVCARILDAEDDIDRLRVLTDQLTDPDVAAVGLAAVSIAGRTSNDDKLRHIATGVAQIINNRSPWVDDIDYTQMLMHLVDDLTATQIAFLHFLAYPTRWEQRTGVSLAALPLGEDGRLHTDTVLNAAFPGYTAQPAALRAVLGGLEARGLVDVIGLADEGSGYSDVDQFRDGSGSALGLALLRFLELES